MALRGARISSTACHSIQLQCADRVVVRMPIVCLLLLLLQRQARLQLAILSAHTLLLLHTCALYATGIRAAAAADEQTNTLCCVRAHAAAFIIGITRRMRGPPVGALAHNSIRFCCTVRGCCWRGVADRQQQATAAGSGQQQQRTAHLVLHKHSTLADRISRKLFGPRMSWLITHWAIYQRGPVSVSLVGVGSARNFGLPRRPWRLRDYCAAARSPVGVCSNWFGCLVVPAANLPNIFEWNIIVLIARYAIFQHRACVRSQP